MDARTAELILAAKGAVVFIADLCKGVGEKPSRCPTLVRLNDAINAMEGTPTTPGGGRMDVEVDTDA